MVAKYGENMGKGCVIRMGNYEKWVWWGTSIAIPGLGPHGDDLMEDLNSPRFL